MSAGQRDRLSDEENCLLIELFSEDEIIEAIANCDTFKRSGPDGFNFKFIKECWHVIKEDFLKMINDFHQFGRLAQGINHSFIVLILKK